MPRRLILPAVLVLLVVLAVLALSSCGKTSGKDFESCVKDEGLQASRKDQSSSGLGQVILVAIPKSSAVVYVLDSDEEAEKKVKDVEIFTKAVGGQVDRKGNVIIGYPRKPPEKEADKIEGCA